MDDPEQRARRLRELVRRVKAPAHVGHDAQDDARRDEHALLASVRCDGRERVAVDVLHDQVSDVVLLADVENLRDVRVLDARRDPRLVQEHLLKTRRPPRTRQDRLDGDELLEAVLAVCRAIHTLAMPPSAIGQRSS